MQRPATIAGARQAEQETKAPRGAPSRDERSTALRCSSERADQRAILHQLGRVRLAAAVGTCSQPAVAVRFRSNRACQRARRIKPRPAGGSQQGQQNNATRRITRQKERRSRPRRRGTGYQLSAKRRKTFQSSQDRLPVLQAPSAVVSAPAASEGWPKGVSRQAAAG